MSKKTTVFCKYISLSQELFLSCIIVVTLNQLGQKSLQELVGLRIPGSETISGCLMLGQIGQEWLWA
jgi:hypothetical protein